MTMATLAFLRSKHRLAHVVGILSLLIGCAGCGTISSAVVGDERSGTTPRGPAATAATEPVEVPACADAGGCLSVLTYNTKHRDVSLQMQAVAKQLKTDLPRMPDFILLQEVVFDRPTSKGPDNTAAVLGDLLGYESRGSARDGGAEGVAILSRHSFEFFDHLHLAARDNLLAGGFPRVSVMGEFQVPGIGRVRVVNTHLAQQATHHDTRRAQLTETLEWMSARQAQVPADVIVFGGDLNIEPQWDELALLRDSTVCGGIVFENYNSVTPSAGKLGDPFQRIDYIFAAAPTHNVGSVGEAILWRDGVLTIDGSARFWPSDHLPLMHVFAINQSPADSTPPMEGQN